MFDLFKSRIVTCGIADFAIVFKYDSEIILILFRYLLKVKFIWIDSFIFIGIFLVFIKVCLDFFRGRNIWRVFFNDSAARMLLFFVFTPIIKFWTAA